MKDGLFSVMLTVVNMTNFCDIAPNMRITLLKYCWLLLMLHLLTWTLRVRVPLMPKMCLWVMDSITSYCSNFVIVCQCFCSWCWCWSWFLTKQS